MIDGDGQTLTRELGSNAYNSTTIGTNTGALTVDNATVQLNSGTTFNGAAARTLSAKTAAIANGGAALATADQIHTFVTGQTDTMAAATTGNAATATTLATARNINGVSFNGSANITVTAAAGTLSGNTLKSSVLASSLTSVGILSALDILGDLEVGNDIKFGTTDAAPQHILDAQDDQIISITDGGLTKLIAAGNLDIGAHTFRASTFYADVATGTAPFTVTSTTPVANLQAATATILHTARNIAGVSFNGSANISLNNNAITNGAGYTTNTGTLTGNGATYRIPIYNGTTSFTTDSGFNYQGNMLSTEALNISSVSAMNSEATSLMINGDSTVGIRELGSNAFNSTTIGTNTGALTVSTGLNLNSGTTFNGSAARTISVDVSDFMTNGADNRIVTATGTDAMNGEANLTFDGTSLIVAGQRPVKITSSTVSIQGQPNSAWATAYLFLGSGTTNRGGYGALGSSDTLTYYYIGDAYNDTTMHIQPNAGNVGIGMSGTTAPTSKLHVNGGKVTISGTGCGLEMPDTAGNPTLKLVTDQNAFTGCNIINGWGNNLNTGIGIGTTRSDGIAMQVRTGVSLSSGFATDSGTTRFIVNGDGNVGIGTTAPSHLLEVQSDTAIASINGATTNGKPQLFIGESNAYGVGFRWDSSLSLDIVDYDNVTPTSTSGTKIGHFKIREEEFYWKGKVGIGTTAPTGILQIEGSTNAYSTAPILYFGSTSTANAAVRDWAIGPVDDNYGSFHIFQGASTGASPLATSNAKFSIRSSGNVGIGINSPASKLHVTDAVNRNMNSSGTGQFQISGNGYQFAVAIGSTTCALYHNSSGRTLSLGTNETARLTIAGNSGDTTCTGTITATDFFTGDNGKIGADATDYITFINNSRADVYINNSLEFRFEADGDFHADGDVVAQSTSVSDSRLKDNIIPISGALDKIKSLRGVSYTWNSGKKKGKQDIGLIAQEVEQVIPEIVKDKKLPLMDGTDPNETYKTIDYEKIIAVLVEAVKDQQTQIDNLEKQIKK